MIYTQIGCAIMCYNSFLHLEQQMPQAELNKLRCDTWLRTLVPTCTKMIQDDFRCINRTKTSRLTSRTILWHRLGSTLWAVFLIFDLSRLLFSLCSQRISTNDLRHIFLDMEIWDRQNGENMRDKGQFCFLLRQIFIFCIFKLIC